MARGRGSRLLCCDRIQFYRQFRMVIFNCPSLCRLSHNQTKHHHQGQEPNRRVPKGPACEQATPRDRWV